MMAAASLYLPPLLALIALQYLAALLILISRCRDLITGARSVGFYEDYAGTNAPPFTQRTTGQLANLFEFPLLFIAAIVFAVACGLQDPWLLKMAWSFVAIRWLHSAIHLGFNKLWIRTPVFMASNLVLLAIWIRLAVLVG